MTNAWGNNVWRERFHCSQFLKFQSIVEGRGANWNSLHGIRQNKAKENFYSHWFSKFPFYALTAPSQWNVITPIQGRAFFPIILLWRHLCSLPRLFQFTKGDSPNQISKFHTYLYSKLLSIMPTFSIPLCFVTGYIYICICMYMLYITYIFINNLFSEYIFQNFWYFLAINIIKYFFLIWILSFIS